MRLSIQNKIQLAIHKLYTDNENIGGTPSRFFLDKKEFGLLLVELHQQGRQENSSFVVKTEDDKSILMKIYREELTNKGINNLIKMWIKKRFTITYKDIPIVYEAPKTKEQKAKENDKKWQG